jgi:hypothetical protein
MADAFDRPMNAAGAQHSVPGYGILAHKEGYSALYGDGHAAWYGDPQRTIMFVTPPGVAGINTYGYYSFQYCGSDKLYWPANLYGNLLNANARQLAVPMLWNLFDNGAGLDVGTTCDMP